MVNENEQKLAKFDFIGEAKKMLGGFKHYEEVCRQVENGTFVKEEEYIYED